MRRMSKMSEATQVAFFALCWRPAKQTWGFTPDLCCLQFAKILGMPELRHALV